MKKKKFRISDHSSKQFRNSKGFRSYLHKFVFHNATLDRKRRIRMRLGSLLLLLICLLFSKYYLAKEKRTHRNSYRRKPDTRRTASNCRTENRRSQSYCSPMSCLCCCRSLCSPDCWSDCCCSCSGSRYAADNAHGWEGYYCSSDCWKWCYCCHHLNLDGRQEALSVLVC